MVPTLMNAQGRRWKRYRYEVFYGLGAANLLGELGGADQIGTDYIKDLEIKINTPMTADYLTQGRIYAGSLLSKNEQLTPEMINQAANLLYQRDRQSAISQLEALQGKAMDKPEETPTQVIEEAMSEYPNKSREDVITALKAGGFLPVDYVEEKELPTQEELITRSGLVNPFRARAKLEQNPFRGFSE